MLFRLLLLLALSAAPTFAQGVTVTMGDYSAKLSAPGFATLKSPTGDARCDVFWKGVEVLVLNGAMEDYEGPLVEDHVTVLYEHKGGPTVLDADVSLPDGTGHIFYLSPPAWKGVPEKWQAWMDGQLAGGPPIDSAPLATLAGVSLLGPKPDLVNPSIT
ncbi:MAG TPA: hypothetical protein VFV84_13740, partial [Burkholderiales bacterium]|nr:hypothetical protein [Burkholderiales bacterium]